MEKTEIGALKVQWRDICNIYAEEFVRRHTDDGEPLGEWYWIADEPGGIMDFCDMFIGMPEIRYDVDHQVDPEKFNKWYWKQLELAELGLTWMNYESFCKGCPDPYPEEDMQVVRESRKKVIESQRLFEDAVRDLKAKKK